MSLTKAFMEYFGKKPGQLLSDFSLEIRTAVSADRQFWISEFTRIGYEIEEPKPAPTES